MEVTEFVKLDRCRGVVPHYEWQHNRCLIIDATGMQNTCLYGGSPESAGFCERHSLIL